MSEVERDIGGLEARMARVEQDIKELRDDVREVLNHVSAAKGGWRTLVTIGSAMTALGAGVATLVSWIRG